MEVEKCNEERERRAWVTGDDLDDVLVCRLGWDVVVQGGGVGKHEPGYFLAVSFVEVLRGEVGEKRSEGLSQSFTRSRLLESCGQDEGIVEVRPLDGRRSARCVARVERQGDGDRDGV